MTYDNIYYVRLVTGEEILCTMSDIYGGILVMDNPMLIESIQDAETGNHMIYLSRFAPYAKDKSMEIAKDQTIMILTCSDLMSEYYSRSLDFSTAFVDHRFQAGIKKAIEYVQQATQKVASQSRTDQLIEEDNEELCDEDEEEDFGVVKKMYH